jgi:hypothetical protein
MQECPTCGRGATALEEMLVEARQQLQDLDREFKQAIREKGRLKAELAKQREESPQAQDARRVFDHWVVRLGKNANTVFGPAREKAVQARLQEFPVEVVLKAVDGCALMPWVGPHGRQADEGKGAKRHDELALICRDETTVERFAGYVDQPTPEPEPRVFRSRRDHPVWDEPVNRILLELRKLELSYRPGGAVGTWMAQCPAHEDREASLSIREVEDRVLLNCFAGCHVAEICDALGMALSQLFLRERAA